MTALIDFCRGRTGVFSDVGTTVEGNRLYAFTHRSFMEYFAASHLAASSGTPESLASTVWARILDPNWTIVVQLSVQIIASATDRGADRVILTWLDKLEECAPRDRAEVISRVREFSSALAPSPSVIRRLGIKP